MRHQLINSLLEDILPQIKNGQAPEDVLVKYARDNNYTPAMLEALGQLLNTAKTISFLEKAANRGGTFPIVDVPTVVERFLEVAPSDAPATKSANASIKWEGDIDDLNDLPGTFRDVLNPENTRAYEEIPVVKKAATAQRGPSLEQLNRNLEVAQQNLFDAQEDFNDTMQGVLKRARMDFDFDYNKLESDARYVLGKEIIPVMDVAAESFKSANIKVVRPADEGKRRMVHNLHLDGIRKLATQFQAIQTAKENFKRAHAARHAPSNADTATSAPPLDPGQDPLTVNTPGGPLIDGRTEPPKSLPSASKADGGKSTGKPGVSENYFGRINDGIDSLLSPARNVIGERVKKLIDAQDNPDQRRVDIAMDDTHQQAILQNLMTTDEVLSEADPERVLESFNTLRQVAPSLARDINVVRVMLRSAVQHDGISPFDVKGLADTELSRQKVDLNQRALNDHIYKRAPLGRAQA